MLSLLVSNNKIKYYNECFETNEANWKYNIIEYKIQELLQKKLKNYEILECSGTENLIFMKIAIEDRVCIKNKK